MFVACFNDLMWVRCGLPTEALVALADPVCRIGLWSSTGAWNHLLAHLQAGPASASAAATAAAAAATAAAAAAAAPAAAAPVVGGVVAEAFAKMVAVGAAPSATSYRFLAEALEVSSCFT
jgi:hypothetical protein